MLKHINHLIERTRFVRIVLPLLALWLPEYHSVAQIQGQSALSALRPCHGRVEGQRRPSGHL